MGLLLLDMFKGIEMSGTCPNCGSAVDGARRNNRELEEGLQDARERDAERDQIVDLIMDPRFDHLLDSRATCEIVAAIRNNEHRSNGMRYSQIIPQTIIDNIATERDSQDSRWGDQSHHPDSTWSDILGEEMGEVCKARLHNEFGGDHAGTLREELVQVAAVAVAWIEAIDKRGEEHRKGDE